LAGNLPCDGGYNYSNRQDARKAELWHAALNSRGRFVPAPDANALVSAFKTILAEIDAHESHGAVSIAARSGRQVADRFVYEASYDNKQWSGKVVAREYLAGDASAERLPVWEADKLLDATALGT